MAKRGDGPPQLGRLGVRLKHRRLVTGLTPRDAADRAGCSENLLSKLENGKATPSLTMLHRIAEALGVNVAALFESGRAGDSFAFPAEQLHAYRNPGRKLVRLLWVNTPPTF